MKQQFIPLWRLIGTPLVASIFFGTFANGMIAFVLALALLRHAGLGVLGTSLAIPAVLQITVGTWIGFVADRRRPRSLLIASYLVFMLAAVAAAGAASTDHAWSSVLAVVGLIVSGGALAAFGSLIAVVVPIEFEQEQFGRANSAIMTAAVAGSVMAPLVAEGVHRETSLGTAALVAVVMSAIAAFLARLLPSAGEKYAQDESPRTPVRDTVTFVLQHRRIRRVALGLAVTWLGIGGINALEVPFVTGTLNAGAGGYAFALAWSSAWMLFGSLLSGTLQRIRIDVLYVVGTIFTALAWFVFGLAPSFLAILPPVAFAAVAGAMLNIGGTSLIQREVAGRNDGGGIITLALSAFHVTGAISLTLWAWIGAELVSVRTTILISSAVALVAAVPAVRMLGSERQESALELDTAEPA